MIRSGERAGTRIRDHRGLKIVAALLCETAQAISVRRRYRCCALHFHSPRRPAQCDDQVDLHLILVAVVPEAQFRFGPSGLGNELLHDESFEQMAEALALRRPVVRFKSGEGRHETAVGQVNLGHLDQAPGFVSVPGW